MESKRTDLFRIAAILLLIGGMLAMAFGLMGTSGTLSVAGGLAIVSFRCP